MTKTMGPKQGCHLCVPPSFLASGKRQAFVAQSLGLTRIQGGPLELSGTEGFEFRIILKSSEISENPSVSG